MVARKLLIIIIIDDSLLVVAVIEYWFNAGPLSLDIGPTFSSRIVFLRQALKRSVLLFYLDITDRRVFHSRPIGRSLQNDPLSFYDVHTYIFTLNIDSLIERNVLSFPADKVSHNYYNRISAHTTTPLNIKGTTYLLIYNNGCVPLIPRERYYTRGSCWPKKQSSPGTYSQCQCNRIFYVFWRNAASNCAWNALKHIFNTGTELLNMYWYPSRFIRRSLQVIFIHYKSRIATAIRGL